MAAASDASVDRRRPRRRAARDARRRGARPGPRPRRAGPRRSRRARPAGSTGAARRWASRDAARSLGLRRRRPRAPSSCRWADSPRRAGIGQGARPVERLPGRATTAAVAAARPAAAIGRARWRPRSAARPPSARASRRRPPASRSCRSQSVGRADPGRLLEPVDHPGAPRRGGSGSDGRSSTRRSTSQRSTSSNRRVRNSRCSTACRSAELARRKAWNRPWGSIATWVNWVQVMPEQAGDELAGLVEPVGQRDPLAGSVLLDDDVGLDPGGAAAAPLGSLPGGGAGEPERPAADAEPQHDHAARPAASAWSLRRWRARVPVAGHLAVEREAHGVEHAGLARRRCRR